MAKINNNESYSQVQLEERPSLKKEKENRKFLYTAAIAANLAAYSCGTTFGWTSPTIPKLLSTTESPLTTPITPEQSSLIGSLLPLGAIFGPFIAGFLSDKIGRKRTLLIAILPLIVGFAMSAFATNVTTFYFARFFWGLTAGGSFTVLPIYMGEISDDEVRGKLGTSMQLFIVLGLLYSFLIGPYISIKSFNLLSLIIPITFFFWFMGYIPETPHFYVLKGKEDHAEQVLIKLRGKSSVKTELDSIISSTEEAMKNKGSFSDIFKVKKALIISLGLMALQQFCGINIIIFYTQSIFDASGSTIPSTISTIIIGFVQVVGSVITPMVIEKKGKRFLLIVSSIFMGIAMTILGGYFYAKDHSYNIDALYWLPITCLITYIIAYCLGAGPLPWALLGELFPPNIKSAASMIAASFCWLLAFLLTLSYQSLVGLIGNSGGFWLFAICCYVGVVLIYKYVPETAGKSLQEIQDMLSKGE